MVIGVFKLPLMQCERNGKLQVLIRRYNWESETKSDTYFRIIFSYKCDNYFGTGGVVGIGEFN